MGWQPIETAPRDGSKFLAFWPELYNDAADIDVTYWHISFEFTGWASSNYWARTADAAPTHWMPLPDAPK